MHIRLRVVFFIHNLNLKNTDDFFERVFLFAAHSESFSFRAILKVLMLPFYISNDTVS